MSTCVHTCGGEKATSSVFFDYVSSHVFWQALSLTPGLTDWLDWLASEFWDPLASTLLSVLGYRQTWTWWAFHTCARDPMELCSHACTADTSLSCLFCPHCAFYCGQDAEFCPTSRWLWMNWNNITTPCFRNSSPHGWAEFLEAKMRIVYLELFCYKPICPRKVSEESSNLFHFLKISLSENV